MVAITQSEVLDASPAAPLPVTPVGTTVPATLVAVVVVVAVFAAMLMGFYGGRWVDAARGVPDVVRVETNGY